ncbi:MAG TPA: hypothetical protein VF316_23490 [Polyangiaceae bacterium]
MEAKVSPFRPDVVAITSAPRPTPTPVRVNFADVLAKGAKGLVAGAEAALNAIPGGPLVAVALRGATGGATATHPLSAGLGGGLGGGVGTARPEGPGATSGGTPGTAGTTGTADGGVESSLQQAQEMNMYYLQIQEQVNAQNRTFSTLSNVLKAEHDTVKTAIGNIR